MNGLTGEEEMPAPLKPFATTRREFLQVTSRGLLFSTLAERATWAAAGQYVTLTSDGLSLAVHFPAGGAAQLRSFLGGKLARCVPLRGRRQLPHERPQRIRLRLRRPRGQFRMDRRGGDERRNGNKIRLDHEGSTGHHCSGALWTQERLHRAATFVTLCQGYGKTPHARRQAPQNRRCYKSIGAP